MTEKLLAKASEKDAVSVGEVVTAKIDVISMIDLFFDDWMLENNLKARDPTRAVFSFRPFPPIGQMAGRCGANEAVCTEAGRAQRERLRHRQTRPFASSAGRGGMGSPDTFYLAADTQAATMGALNCFAMAGIYSTLPAVASGEMWAWSCRRPSK